MSRGFENRQPDIWRGPAQRHDIRFAAALDIVRFEVGFDIEGFRKQRIEHWRQFTDTNRDNGAGLFVARHGGLYVGYLALDEVAAANGREVDEESIFIRPPYDATIAASRLMDFAKVSIRPVSIPFAARNDQVGELTSV